MINLKNFKYHFFHRLTSSKNSAHSASNGTYVAPIDSRRLFSSSNGSTVDRKPMSNLNRNNESSAAANGSKSSSTRSLNRTGNGSVIGSGGGSNRVGTPNAVRRSTATLGNAMNAMILMSSPMSDSSRMIAVSSMKHEEKTRFREFACLILRLYRYTH